MLQTCFKKDGMRNYMVISAEREFDTDYQSQLFQCQKVPCFLQYEIRELNGCQTVYYVLQQKMSLSWALDHLTFTYERVRNIVSAIIVALETAEEYLFDQEKIIWRTDCMFMDAEGQNLQMCYYPGEGNEGSLKEVMTQLIHAVDKKEEETILFLLHFYNRLMEPDCTPDKLREFKADRQNGSGAVGLEAENGERNEVFIWEDPERARAAENDAERDIRKGEDRKRNLARLFGKKQEQTKGGEDIPGSCEEKGSLPERIVRSLLIADGLFTLVLMVCIFGNILSFDRIPILFAGVLSVPVLTIFYFRLGKEESPDDIMQEYFAKNRESDSKRDSQLCLMALGNLKYPPIHMEDGGIVLGSMAESCNYVLRARGVSRIHAKIIERKDGVYLLDLNSTNGTYLNGERIESGQDYKLEEGDMVAFALSEFYVAREPAAQACAVW